MSQEAALAYAEKCGIVVSNEISMDHRLSLSMTKEVFNFCVYKWNKVRTVQRLILQVRLNLFVKDLSLNLFVSINIFSKCCLSLLL